MKITYYSIVEESNIDELERRINKIMKEDKDTQPLGGVSYNPKTGKVCQVLVDVEDDYTPMTTVADLDDVHGTLKEIKELLEAQQKRNKSII